MSHLSTTVAVAAPARLVFDIVADPSRGPDWQTLVDGLGEISGRPGGVGSSYVGYYRVAGRRLEGRFVVTAAERPSLHQVAGTTPGGWVRWTTLIEEVPGGCELRVTLEYELPGEIVSGIVGRLTGNRLEREFGQTYANLKALAERQALAEAEAQAEPDVELHQAAVS